MVKAVERGGNIELKQDVDAGTNMFGGKFYFGRGRGYSTTQKYHFTKTTLSSQLYGGVATSARSWGTGEVWNITRWSDWSESDGAFYMLSVSYGYSTK